MRNDSENKCKTYDVTVIAGANLVQLHEHVTRTLERIEVTRPTERASTKHLHRPDSRAPVGGDEDPPVRR